MTRNQDDLLGIGLYTTAEAARLAGLSAAKLRRWLGGYEYVHAGERRWSPPLWRPQLPRLDDQLGVGFLDLVQLRVAAALIEKAGLSLHAVRLALTRAREVLRHDHPFATASFRTDGRRVFLEIAEEAAEPQLFDLLARQYAFHKLVEPSFRNLDIEDGEAARWWPIGRNRQVLVDPDHAFGRPVGSGSGIPTATLAATAAAEGSPRAVTGWFDVGEREVRDAILFERRFAA